MRNEHKWAAFMPFRQRNNSFVRVDEKKRGLITSGESKQFVYTDFLTQNSLSLSGLKDVCLLLNAGRIPVSGSFISYFQRRVRMFFAQAVSQISLIQNNQYAILGALSLPTVKFPRCLGFCLIVSICFLNDKWP